MEISMSAAKRFSKKSILALILQTVSKPHQNLYDRLVEEGYPREKAWRAVPTIKKRGYIDRVGFKRYKLTPKGKEKLAELGSIEVNPLCPYCGSPRTSKQGFRQTKKNNRQRFLCQDCNQRWVEGTEWIHRIESLKRNNRGVFIVAVRRQKANFFWELSDILNNMRRLGFEVEFKEI